MNFVGIDYSITCPCVCVGIDKNFHHSSFYFLKDNKNVVGKRKNIVGNFHDEYMSDQERYENIAEWVMQILEPLDKAKTHIAIEDYSFGSKGRVFNLAENCGLMKYMLYKDNWRFHTFPPSVIKKYATGKGNADKQKMYDAFHELTKVDLISIYSKSNKLDSPVTDIVDAFYLTNYMHDSILDKLAEKINESRNNKQL